jgi:hypothetical protein
LLNISEVSYQSSDHTSQRFHFPHNLSKEII